jgi:hypothetical protein
MLRASQGDQDVVGAELVHGLVEGGERRLVTDATLHLHIHRLQVTEHGPKTLVGLVAGAIGVADEPLQPARQDRRDDEDLRGGVDQAADERRKLIDVGHGRTCGDEQAPAHRPLPPLKAQAIPAIVSASISG